MKLTGKSIFSGKGLEISVFDGHIDRVEERDLEEEDLYLSPGFFDIQVNGYLNNDYSAPDLSKANINRMVKLLASSGTTRHIPTIITSSHERIVNNLKVIRQALENLSDLIS